MRKFDLKARSLVWVNTQFGIADGTVIISYTGSEKRQVIVRFDYLGATYELPFSRKTGKIYGQVSSAYKCFSLREKPNA